MVKPDNHNQLADVLISEEVIAFPLDVREPKDIGGLVDSDRFQLIEEAIDRGYWNESYQEMCKIDNVQDFCTQIPRIEELVFFVSRRLS